MKQRTLSKSYLFWGKGLHTGCYSHMRIKPASVDTGIVFVRSDKHVVIPALAENVSSTARSTTLSVGRVSVGTVEHVLSALTGLGIDIDNKEVPILDGSARFYTDKMADDPLVEQDAERKWVELDQEVCFENPRTGSYIKLVPADELSIDVTIDFDSRVLGVQKTHWDMGCDYVKEVAPCRTFCFLHEIQHLAALGLVKGGDVENAIVVVEKPVSGKKLSRLARAFNQPELSVTRAGYLSNLELRFPDECGRHKLLDVIGDMRLCGGFLKARVEAYKPGHATNTSAAKLVRKLIK